MTMCSFILEIQKGCLCPALTSGNAHADTVEKANQKDRNHACRQRYVGYTDSCFSEKPIQYEEKEQNRQEPQPTLTYESVAEVKVSGPVFLRQLPGIQENEFVEWNQDQHGEKPRHHETFELERKKRPPVLVSQRQRSKEA